MIIISAKGILNSQKAFLPPKLLNSWCFLPMFVNGNTCMAWHRDPGIVWWFQGSPWCTWEPSTYFGLMCPSIYGKGEEVHIYFQLSPMCVVEEVSLDDPTVLIWPCKSGSVTTALKGSQALITSFQANFMWRESLEFLTHMVE